MTKVIFLDIDGVLNILSDSYYTTRFREDGAIKHIEEHLTSRLSWLLNKTRASIVISSSWRLSMNDLQEQMEKEGFEMWDRVIGRTSISKFENRGEEIEDWISKHPEIKNFVVIDDEFVDICGDKFHSSELERRFVQVDFENGLSHKDVLKAIKILEEK